MEYRRSKEEGGPKGGAHRAAYPPAASFLQDGPAGSIRILLQTLDVIHGHHGVVRAAVGSEEDNTDPGVDKETIELQQGAGL